MKILLQILIITLLFLMCDPTGSSTPVNPDTAILKTWYRSSYSEISSDTCKTSKYSILTSIEIKSFSSDSCVIHKWIKGTGDSVEYYSYAINKDTLLLCNFLTLDTVLVARFKVTENSLKLLMFGSDMNIVDEYKPFSHDTPPSWWSR